MLSKLIDALLVAACGASLALILLHGLDALFY
jgi:hypothetical protein